MTLLPWPEMSYDDCEAVIEMDDINMGDMDYLDHAFNSLPPGEEGFDMSEAGGDHEVFEGLADELNNLPGLYVCVSPTLVHSTNFYCVFSKRVDDRVRRNRVETRNQDWDNQMDRLVDTYLQYQMHDDGELRCQPPPPDNPSGQLEIEVVDVFCMFFSLQTAEKY
jgi:hypothetical protein